MMLGKKKVGQTKNLLKKFRKKLAATDKVFVEIGKKKSIKEKNRGRESLCF